VVVEEQTTVIAQCRMLHQKPQKAWPLLMREYSAIPPVMRTIRTFQDGQYLLGCTTVILLLVELALVCNTSRLA